MSSQDWFRRTTWSARDAADFEARLGRTRSQRLEYLRIQAYTLAETGTPALAIPAIELAHRYLREAPESPLRAHVYSTLSRALDTIEDVEGAIDAYRRGIDIQSQNGPRGCIYLDFGWYAVRRGLTYLYDEVVDTFERCFRDDDLAMPASQYMFFGTLAVISDEFGDAEFAMRMARNALKAARAKRSPFARHPDVGLVRNTDSRVHHILEQLAG